MTQRARAFTFIGAGAAALVIGVFGMIWASSDESGESATSTTTTVAAPTSTIESVAATTIEAATTTAAAVATTDEVTATTVEATSPTVEATTTTVPPATTTTIAPEDPTEFVNALIGAQAAGDIDILLARLHPEVFTRYGGEEPCRSYLESVTFPEVILRELLEPAPWDYATDGIITTFPDAIGVEVERVVDGETLIQELHIVYEGPELRWFTDCGEPV